MKLLLVHPLLDGKIEIGHQQHIAHIINCGEREDDVGDGTDTQQSAEIEECLVHRQTLAHLIHGSQSHNDDGPHGNQEDGDQRGCQQRIERGMEIEMAPQLGREILDGGIERGRSVRVPWDKDSQCR